MLLEMGDFRLRSLGALFSPHDSRDIHVAAAIPIKAVTRPFVLPTPPVIADQDGVGACVAYSLVKYVKAYQEYQERAQWLDFSANYLYQRREPTDFQGSGMYPRQALANLLKRGVPLESVMPGIKEYGQATVPANADREAFPQHIAGYVAIYKPEEVLAALEQLGPVTIAIDVYDSFYQGGRLSVPDTSKETNHGGHMMTIWGVMPPGDDYYIVANSWGPNWGPGVTLPWSGQHIPGFCLMPFSYPIHEMWSVTDFVPSRPAREIIFRPKGNQEGPWTGSKTAVVDGQTVEMDVEPVIDVAAGRSLLPARFLAEHLGCEVISDDKTGTVTIKRVIP